jgi:hypothetical protein
VASTSASTSFSWDDFGIGIAAALGLALLTGGLAVAVRTGHASGCGSPRRCTPPKGAAALR